MMEIYTSFYMCTLAISLVHIFIFFKSTINFFYDILSFYKSSVIKRSAWGWEFNSIVECLLYLHYEKEFYMHILFKKSLNWGYSC